MTSDDFRLAISFMVAFTVVYGIITFLILKCVQDIKNSYIRMYDEIVDLIIKLEGLQEKYPEARTVTINHYRDCNIDTYEDDEEGCDEEDEGEGSDVEETQVQ